MSKVRSLDTIAALRELAGNFRRSAPEARAVAGLASSKDIKRVLNEEATKFETIASDLEEIADEVAQIRAFKTARFLMGPVSQLSEEEATPIIEIIRTAPAYEEFTAPLAAESETTCTVRLVPFYDATIDEERWAVHYSNTDGDEGISDNACQEDAEFRYWEIAGPLGQERSE